MFILDPAFAATSEPLLALRLSEARLQDDARYAWIVLVPRVPGAVELEDLDPAQRALFVEEMIGAGRAVRAIGEALGRPVAKLNVGQLGNITRQLHVHIVGRRKDDAGWPGPVWGQGKPERYASEDLPLVRAAALQALRSTLVGD